MATIQLEEAEYWKLLKLESDLRYAQEKAAQILAPVQQARAAHLKMLTAKYPEMTPDGSYRADDATWTLTVT
jgi:hypothetical protein